MMYLEQNSLTSVAPLIGLHEFDFQFRALKERLQGMPLLF